MVALSGKGVSVNGEYKVLVCASFFYFRIPKTQWAERADALVSAGYNTVDVYFPWNWHELEPGVYRFDGDADVDEFLKICADRGLMIVARPGPYICSEWDNGALPAWIAAKGNLRSADKMFLADVKKWYDQILPHIKKFEYNGKGGVILLQLDNELDFFDCPDPDTYIGALRDMALAHGISVPLFACAGQLCAPNAGGKTKGVAPTYNFYPNSFDETYDSVMRYYADALQEQNLPLLISETNRDAFLLRREFASGAKLLGAYNQVGGSNFGFTESVNNWGQPLSFLTAMYDFWSLVTTLGEYSGDIDRQRIFNGFLRAVPEIGAAVPYHGDIKVNATFTAAEQSNALQLPSGGVVVCVSDFSGDGTAEVTACGHTVKLSMIKEESIFLPFNVKFGKLV
ncbi:MAG: beta-galactosidase, partial [Clostridiales bacterium]|nr:beta-galactosidase [Clostridiales bacterium]